MDLTERIRIKKIDAEKIDTENASLGAESIFVSRLDDEFEKGVDAEIRAYHKLHPSLLQQHSGEFVAIHDQQLVDHDRNKLALYQRVHETYPEQFVLMRQVEEVSEQDIHFRSTRFFIQSL